VTGEGRPAAHLLQRDGAGRVAVLRLNRPEKRNALSWELIAEFEAALADLDSREECRALVLTGTGGSFCAGADLSLLSGLGTEGARRLSERLQALAERLAQLSQVTVAAVEGYALGGGMELALACDLRVAAAGARFGVPEVRLGLFPAAGGTARLVELLGRSLAARLLLTGEPLGPAELPQGFLAAVVRDGEAEAAARRLAEAVAAHPPAAVQAIKSLLAASRDAGHALALRLETLAFAELAGRPDVQERIEASLRRRTRP
jgi:enoyl-CoA hydratase/carnithine racemase